jgi:phage-related tail protein
VLVDVAPSEQDAAKCAAVLHGDAGAAAEALLAVLRANAPAGGAPLLGGAADWVAALQGKVAGAREKLAGKLARTAFPLDYHTTLRVVRDEINALPQPAVVVSEGANTMDNARCVCA